MVPFLFCLLSTLYFLPSTRWLFYAILYPTMLGIILNLPPFVEQYLNTTPPELMASQALLIFGWIPVFGVIVWGMTHIWMDYKQELYDHHVHYHLLEIKIPQNTIQTPKGMDNFFANLAGSRSSITWREKWLIGKTQPVFSFEIASNGGDIHFYIRLPDRYRDLVEADLYAQYPEAQITEVEDYVKRIPTKYPDEQWEAFGAEFILSKPQYLPIRTYEDFEHQGEKEGRFKDPLLSILELMGKMGPNENYWMQILIRMPDGQEWTKEGVSFASKVMGKEEKHKSSLAEDLVGGAMSLPMEAVRQLSGVTFGASGGAEKKSDDFRAFKLTPAEKLQIEGVTDKISKIGWQTKIRVVYSAKKTNFRKGMMAAGMKGMMAAYTNTMLNQFGMHNPSIPKDDYFWMEWQYAGKQSTLTKRYARRSLGPGASLYILNSEELATLYHFPGVDARTPVLTSLGARRSEAPNTLPYAPAGDDDMQDWKKQNSPKDEKTPEDHAAMEESFHVPVPHAPTGGHHEPQMPSPGKPAPLPPGVHGHFEKPSYDDSVPPNLPV
jgi:hypothetical protein